MSARPPPPPSYLPVAPPGSVIITGDDAPPPPPPPSFGPTEAQTISRLFTSGTGLASLGKVSEHSLFTLSDVDPSKFSETNGQFYQASLIGSRQTLMTAENKYIVAKDIMPMNDEYSFALAKEIAKRSSLMQEKEIDFLDHDHGKDMASSVLETFKKTFTDPNLDENSKVFTGTWTRPHTLGDIGKKPLEDTSTESRLSATEVIDKILEFTGDYQLDHEGYKDGFQGTITLHDTNVDGEESAGNTLWYRWDDITDESLHMTEKNVKAAKTARRESGDGSDDEQRRSAHSAQLLGFTM